MISVLFAILERNVALRMRINEEEKESPCNQIVVDNILNEDLSDMDIQRLQKILSDASNSEERKKKLLLSSELLVQIAQTLLQISTRYNYAALCTLYLALLQIPGSFLFFFLLKESIICLWSSYRSHFETLLTVYPEEPFLSKILQLLLASLPSFTTKGLLDQILSGTYWICDVSLLTRILNHPSCSPQQLTYITKQVPTVAPLIAPIVVKYVETVRIRLEEMKENVQTEVEWILTILRTNIAQEKELCSVVFYDSLAQLVIGATTDHPDGLPLQTTLQFFQDQLSRDEQHRTTILGIVRKDGFRD